MEIEDLSLWKHTSMTISSDFKPLRTFTKGMPPVHLVNRTGFDAFLRRRAIEEGAIPLEDQFVDIARGKALFRSGREMAHRRIVGADGACSRVRRCFLKGRTIRQSPALSSIVPLSERAVKPFQESGLQIFFFRGFQGYGWLFPRKEDVVVGAGSFGSGTGRLKDLMGRLLVHTGLGTSHQLTGGILPAGDQPVNPGTGDILLVGDAAGLCDRISGEGISHAVESGFAAARAIIDGSETWREKAGCIDLVLQSMKYRKYLYSVPFRSLALRALKRGDGWYRRYWSIVSGEMDYSSLFWK